MYYDDDSERNENVFDDRVYMAWLLAFGENLIAQLANKVIWIMANNYSIKWPRYIYEIRIDYNNYEYCSSILISNYLK